MDGAGVQAEDVESDHAKKVGWKALFSFTTKKHIPILCIGVVLSVVAGLVMPGQAYLLGKVFSAFVAFGVGSTTKSKLMDDVSKYCVYFTGLGSASWLLHAGFFTAWMTFGELQANSARDRLFRALLDREMRWYDMRKNGVGALTTRLQMHTGELKTATSQPLGYTISCLSITVSSFALALYFSWKLTLVILASTPVVAVFMTVLSSRIQPNIDAQMDKLTEAAKYTTNAFSSIETVKCFNGQDSELWKYSTLIREAAKSYIRQTRWNSLQAGFMRLSTLGMFVQGFWYGTSLVNSGKLDAGKVLTTFWAALTATQGLIQFMPLLIVLEKGRMAGARLRTVMAEMQKSGRAPGPRGRKVLNKCSGDIDMRNVFFAYPTRPNQLALDNATLFFPAGELTFVVGKSGSGKSTLGQLLMHYYPPQQGSICLDSIPLSSLDIDWLRKNVTLVEQQSVLFEETVFRNIAFGRPDYHNVTLIDVKAAAEFAILQQMIHDMPQGYETMVSAKGNSMSGGQKQRMAIARARLRDTPILLLDEPTSALDYITRSLIMDAIRHWRRGKTTIVITHDISQILPEDYVYVLEKGRVVQEGYRRVIEQRKDSAFQSFLKEEIENGEAQVADRSKAFPDESPGSTDSVPDGRSLTGSSKSSLSLVGPLEEYLEERDIPEMPYIPTVFTNRLGTPRDRESMRLPAVVSPFWRVMPPTTTHLLSPTSGGRHNLSDRPIPSQFATSTYPPTATTRDALVARDKMMDHSGKLGSESRGTDSAKNPLKLTADNAEQVSLNPKRKRYPSLKRSTKSKQNDAKVETLRNILKTVWSALTWLDRVLLVVAFCGAIIHAIATPVFSWVFSKLLSTFYTPENRMQRAFNYSMGVLAVAIGDAAALYLMQSLFEYCSQMWVNRIRLRAMTRILEQPRSFFDEEENSVSRMAETLDNHAEEMRNLVGRFIGFIFVAVLMMVTAIIWSIVSCWKLTLVGLATAPLLYIITVSFEKVSAMADQQLNDAAERVGAIFNETFTNIKTVRSLTLEDHFQAKYTGSTEAVLKLGIKRSIYCGVFFGLVDSAIIFVTALVFYYGAVLLSTRQFTAQHITTVLTQLLFGMSTANSIVTYIPQMSTARDAATRLLRLAKLPQDSHEHVGKTRIPSVGDIAFNDLSFYYPSRPKQTVLRGVNMSIQAGTCIAIVGSSGSGKSTIASLLLNLYTTGATTLDTAPTITLAGRDIKRIHTPTLRSLITIVSQTPTLFPATVGDNIAYGLHRSSPYNNHASVRAAATAAGIDEFIMSLPQGYETIIGEGGMGLSGGQAQRIVIARALVRQPNVLILDEATSALDVQSADIVREAIMKLIRADRLQAGGSSGRSEGMTVIIITHSRDMMAIAEHIIMLDQGRVVEQGGFDELIRRKGRVSERDKFAGSEREAEVNTMILAAMDVAWPAFWTAAAQKADS